MPTGIQTAHSRSVRGKVLRERSGANPSLEPAKAQPVPSGALLNALVYFHEYFTMFRHHEASRSTAASGRSWEAPGTSPFLSTQPAVGLQGPALTSSGTSGQPQSSSPPESRFRASLTPLEPSFSSFSPDSPSVPSSERKDTVSREPPGLLLPQPHAPGRQGAEKSCHALTVVGVGVLGAIRFAVGFIRAVRRPLLPRRGVFFEFLFLGLRERREVNAGSSRSCPPVLFSSFLANRASCTELCQSRAGRR